MVKKVADIKKLMDSHSMFIINLKRKKLYQIINGPDDMYDWSDKVIDWALFKEIVGNGHEEKDFLCLSDIGGPDGFIFWNPRIGMVFHIKASSVFGSGTEGSKTDKSDTDLAAEVIKNQMDSLMKVGFTRIEALTIISSAIISSQK